MNAFKKCRIIKLAKDGKTKKETVFQQSPSINLLLARVAKCIVDNGHYIL